MPCQSHGAEGVDGSQVVKALSGSRRFSLKVVKAWISEWDELLICVAAACVKVNAMKVRNIAVVAICVCLWVEGRRRCTTT